LTETASEGKITRNIGSLFDTLDGNFIARLREISLNTRTTADGRATITFRTARIEAVYSQISSERSRQGDSLLFLMLCLLV
jgi:hypothetical protein